MFRKLSKIHKLYVWRYEHIDIRQLALEQKKSLLLYYNSGLAHEHHNVETSKEIGRKSLVLQKYQR